MATKTIDIIETTIKEHDLLVKAATDFGNTGKTDKKCPRCGNEIVLEMFGTSYDIKCKTPKCIKASFRGI